MKGKEPNIFIEGFCPVSISILNDSKILGGLIRNYWEFQGSGIPSRIMLYQNGSWDDFPQDTFEELKSGFSAKKAVVKIAMKGSNYICHFLHKTLINTETRSEQSIGWIDVDGRRFFPDSVVGQEFYESERYFGLLELKSNQNCGKNKRYPEEKDDARSSDNRSDTLKKKHRAMEPKDTKWPYVKKLLTEDPKYSLIKDVFLTGLKNVNPGASVTSIHKCLHTGILGFAHYNVFKNQIRMMSDVQVAEGWFGTSAKGILNILNHGFSIENKSSAPNNSFGDGIHLSAYSKPEGSYSFSELDENGEKHVLLCRLITGNVEKVEAGSKQDRSSSSQYDTGIDNIYDPSWHIVWSNQMNTHISPEWIVTYKPSDMAVLGSASGPSSLWFANFVSEMKTYLSTSKFQDLENLYYKYKDGKIEKEVFLRQLKSKARDELLDSTLQNIRDSI